MSLLLLQRFEAFAESAAAAPAVRYAGDTLSYGELNAAAAELAAALEGRVARGARIGLRMAPGPDMLIGMLGILKAGAAWVPLSVDDASARTREIVRQAELELILTDRPSVDDLGVPGADIAALRAAAPATLRRCELSDDDLCYVMFTSGSTGQPKGVKVTHANVAGLFSALEQDLAFSPADCWSALHACTFGYSVWETWGALANGACLEIVPQAERKDPAAWFPRVLDAGVSVLSLTPSGLRQLLAADVLSDDLQQLRLIVLSGEAVNEADIERWFARYGDYGPRLINTYALTETAGRITWHEYRPGVPLVAGNIGVPVADAEVYVLDASNQPVAQGAEGELCVAGPMLAEGYLNDTALTAERFTVVELADGQIKRVYRTGDRARLSASGKILFTGRTDTQIKLRGHRIDLGEIERALRAHPEVQDATVVLQTDGAAPRLSAFVVRQPEGETGAAEFWPSLGEYQIYDDLLYDFMSADEVRVASYQRAFEATACDKVVLDIGTGKDAILARLAAAAGARKVYAVEVIPEACEQARTLVARLGLSDTIEVLQGDMQELTLPEPVDICTQGIVGNIGSSDGIVPIWESARRFFAADYQAVPSACTTLIAPAELPAELRGQVSFGPLAAEYAARIFAAAGHEFDVRLCVRNFPQQQLLAAPTIFEQLDFEARLSAAYSHNCEIEIERDGGFDGFLLWTNIQTGATETVDFFEHQQAWLPVWFPLGDTPAELRKGDRLAVRWSCTTPDGQIFPDYRVSVQLPGEAAERVYSSRHFETAVNSTALHRQLLGSVGARDIDSWLAAQLPAHMMPAEVHELATLPLNDSGKVDRQALAAGGGSATVAPQTDPAQVDDALLQALAAIWGDVLGHTTFTLDDEFFDSGGDSILAVRLTTEVQRLLDDTVFLAALFEAPTIRRYGDWLRTHHADAVARCTAQTAVAIAPTLVAGPRDTAPVPLAYPQQSLFFLQQLYPEHTGANEQFLIRVRGKVALARIEQAWLALLERHDVLRSAFSMSSSDALAVQTATAMPELLNALPQRVDLQTLSAAAAQARLRADAELDIARSFDLRQAPLLRAYLYTLPDAERVLLVTAHHIIADGMCVQLIRDELAALCTTDELPLPAYQYADFARWQTQQLTRDAVSADLDWWRQRLAGHSGQPPSLAQSGAAGAREARFAFQLPAELADTLRAQARANGATLFMTLLAAWRVWLARCLMEKDLLLGSPVTLRRDESTATMLGCMVNNVVFRQPLDMNLSFRAALEAEREGALAAMERSLVPFEQVVEAVQPERHLGRHPLFQLLFLYEDRTAPPVEIDGLRFAADVLPVERASYWDLELSVTDCGPGQALPCFIGVRRDVYDADALSWWPEGFVSMLEALAAAPDTVIGRLPLLSARQRQRVLVEWNDTTFDPGEIDTLHELVFAQAAATPERIAIRDGVTQVSYAELCELAECYAHALQAEGIQPGERVGLCLPRGIQSIAVQLGLLRCGAHWLPLDPAYPAERLQLMLADAAPSLVVAMPGMELPECARRSPEALLELGQQRLGVGAAARWPKVRSHDVAYVLYTSGSTGKPKGVLATHGSAVSRCRWMWQAYGFRASDIFGQRTSLNFVDSVWEIFGALAHGACVDVLPAEFEQDARGMLRWMQEANVAHLAMVPSLLEAVLDEIERDAAPACLHTLISSGESLPPALAERVHALLPDCRLLNTYGTSETWDVSCFDVTPESLSRGMAIGKPVANASLCILDAELQPVPPGVEGELFAGGLGLAREYLGQPELTADRFLVNPLTELDTQRLYRTGDRARFRADGVVELIGRADRQIKLRGVRIEKGDIESQVLKRAEIAQCVVAVQSATERDDWLALYVVPAVGAEVDVLALREYLQRCLPRTMVPADIVVLPELPLTPSGKIDTRALPASDASDAARVPYEVPGTELEQLLAATWAETLGVERVGRHDDFFALRGHSLLATQMMARLSAVLELEIPLHCLFEAPTVAGLARNIEALRWTVQPADGHEDPADDAGEREVVRL